MKNKLEIIIGTYEEFLLGYKLEEIEKNKFTLTQSFATRSHAASIRCIGCNGRYVASGGADDKILVYDMKNRREVQVLLHHNGTVNALTFTPDNSHILSVSDDGQMIATKINTWQNVGIWKKAHGGSPVTEISCHPSGKLALTLGKDLTLRTWNLIKGRLVYTTNLKSKKSLGYSPSCISWSLDGDYFTIAGPQLIEIWSIETAGIIKEKNCDSKPICVCWISNDCVLLGLENGKIMMLFVHGDNEDEIKMFNIDSGRIKSISCLDNFLATISSMGELCIWDVDISNKSISKITSTNIGCRPTCLQILDLNKFGEDYEIAKKEEIEEITLNDNETNEKSNADFGTVHVEYSDSSDEDKVKNNKANESKRSLKDNVDHSNSHSKKIKKTDKESNNKNRKSNLMNKKYKTKLKQ